MELETENSQRSNGKGGDVEMVNIYNAPFKIDSNDEEESLTPFKKFLQFKKANGNNYSFQCKLSISKVHEIRTHKNSNNNVKRISRKSILVDVHA